MIIYNEAKKDIVKVWGKQIPDIERQYRLMKYVLRIEENGIIALHNNVTGELIGLNNEEVTILNSLPLIFSDEMKELVEKRFLVPEDYDEFNQIVNLRKIFRTIDKTKHKKDGINRFTILPTTACNARCYYCFEEGVKTVTMTEEIADRVVDFIVNNCGSKNKVKLSWYGGEPTVASSRIKQISLGVKNAGIEYESMIRTNGYLFDDDMIKEAKDIWNLKLAHITVDGVGDTYMKIKNYKNACNDPYNRVLYTIGKFIENGIHVTVRMNYDLINYSDFELLVNDLKEKYGTSELLHVYAQQISGNHIDYTGEVHHGTNEWFAEKSVELNEIVRTEGFKSLKEPDIPHLLCHGCAAESDDYTIITPDGKLARCMESFEADSCIGDIEQGITNVNLMNSWKILSDLVECKNCAYYPICPKVERCPGCGKCVSHSRNYNIEFVLKSLLK